MKYLNFDFTQKQLATLFEGGYESSDTGTAFENALEKSGIEFCGNSRGWVVEDAQHDALLALVKEHLKIA